MIGCQLWKRRSQQFKPETGGEPDSGVGLLFVPRAIFSEFAYISDRLSVISYTTP